MRTVHLYPALPSVSASCCQAVRLMHSTVSIFGIGRTITSSEHSQKAVWKIMVDVPRTRKSDANAKTFGNIKRPPL